MPDIETRTIQARVTFGPTREVEAYAVPNNDNLAVYESFSVSGAYVVTNVPTGLAVWGYPFANYFEGVAFAMAISHLPGVNVQSTEELADDIKREMREECRRIFSEGNWREEAQKMIEESGITFVCDECCEDFPGLAEMTDHNGVEMCEDCAEECNRCDRCERISGPHEFTERVDGQDWCETCASDYAFCCERCNEHYHVDDAHDLNYTTLCHGCFDEVAERCMQCGDHEHVDEMYAVGYDSICQDCRNEYYSRCYDCEELVHDDNRIEVEDDCGCCYRQVCEDCSDGYDTTRNTEDFRDIRATVLKGKERPEDDITHGVEVETEFESGSCPFRIGPYHSDYPAGPEFFSGWHAESDCSLHGGGEFIAPPLSGAAGLAEILATFKVLKDAGGKMPSRCGQHTTVYVGSPQAQIEAQYIMLALEEALLCLTGSMRRIDHGYCGRIKRDSWNMDSAARKALNTSGVATAKRGNLIEFRYPPGTLVGTQAAINVGLCRMMAMMARNPEDAFTDVVEESVAIQRGNDPEYRKIHRQIILGLDVLAEQGWRVDGEMNGLPYDPDDAPTIRLEDVARGHDTTVPLPPRERIAERMSRQITRFYDKMADRYSIDQETKEVMLEEALAAIGIRVKVEA